jgi:adhesin/invasin
VRLGTLVVTVLSVGDGSDQSVRPSLRRSNNNHHVMFRGRRPTASSRSALCALRPSTSALALLVVAACGGGGNGIVSAESIALTASASPTLSIGQTVKLYVHASDANGTRIPAFDRVTWSSSVPTVASVAKTDTTGVVTGLAIGETVISATVRSGVAAQITVRVGSIPVIGLAPSAAVFTGYRGLAVVPQSISITNTGAGTLTSLTATSSASWLQPAFVDGNTTANPTATLRLQPSVGTLADGTHSAMVTVSSSVAGVAARTIPVTFQVAPGPVPFKIGAVSSQSQGGSAGRAVAQPPSVIVRAVDDTPVPGVPVTFAVSGGGVVVPTGVITTNAQGVAALTSWTLGTQPGASQTVTASSPGLAGSPITFTATALEASKIAKASGDNQSGVLGRPLPQSVVVTVTDPNDVPVPNATVAFSASPGGSVVPALATTDANGRATGIWTLSKTLGPQTATASLVGPQGSPSVTFSATATGATTIVKVSGDGQQAAAGAQLPAPLTVKVLGANDQPVVDVTVAFGGDGTATPATATTDANGEATTRWTLPPSTGPKSMAASIATAAGSQSVTFGASATAPPPGGITIVDGDNQTGRAASPLAKQVVARVVTTIGTAVPNATVTFTPASGASQSFAPASGTTDANGEVRTTWTLGSALGTYTATVASSGLPSRTITAVANLLPPNLGVFTGSAVKVPSGSAPTDGDQAMLSYSGPASGQVSLTGGSFTTAALPAGTYTLSVSSGSGAFPTTSVYAASLPGGQTTSAGTIPLAYPGSGVIQMSAHSCTNISDENGTMTVRLYGGVNGDQGGTVVRSWSGAFGVIHNEPNVPYGIYTMTITAQHNSDPTKTCQVYRAGVQHSFLTTGSATQLDLILMSNP